MRLVMHSAVHYAMHYVMHRARYAFIPSLRRELCLLLSGQVAPKYVGLSCASGYVWVHRSFGHALVDRQSLLQARPLAG